MNEWQAGAQICLIIDHISVPRCSALLQFNLDCQTKQTDGVAITWTERCRGILKLCFEWTLVVRSVSESCPDLDLHPGSGRAAAHSAPRGMSRTWSYGLQKDSDYFQKPFCGDLIGEFIFYLKTFFPPETVCLGNAPGEFILSWNRNFRINPIIMFQHKKCFTIESLVGKDSNSSSAGDEPIRPTALRYTESVHPAPFGSCFQNSARTLYGNVNADMMFPDPGSHSANSALALRHLPIPTQPFFTPHQRDSLHFYPWVLRNRYLGHRFQGQY